ncbi:hypothetical protein ACOMHN_035941 [Nucella lapillus]
MSAFAASFMSGAGIEGGAGGSGGGMGESVHSTDHSEVQAERGDLNFWQRLQLKYRCCLIDLFVNFFCPIHTSCRMKFSFFQQSENNNER